MIERRIVKRYASALFHAASRAGLVDKIESDLGQVKDDVAIIKLDIETIKNDLKQKVSREEFVILEKRVGMLEAKSRK